ncbi:SusC/RagA family TonB-linked outer membrane protein [Mucilaginibacter sp. AK015]|uniref:SusC/RagA family TonB-linked outer membrane protein n=1 Tax=Mucilaginibacter sp. AK015 TaxID=2723072 RepID=UPI00161790C4|nr:SusC/RagA family TonB-linked outer membrane protein [Mucilaginibacter sp. AK015]MBB5396680.1 TonB-linked SusC/RagA family outer membrane protein [Mucilaginibacter sp. AK015]
MKFTAFILLAFCIQVSATALAQKITLSERKAPLEKVINEIKKQTGYSFFYNQEWLQAAQPVDVQLKNASLEQALKSAFAGQPFDYAIVNNTIVLKLKDQTLTDKERQSVVPVTVNGRVVDSVGTPLIGATVAIKGSSKATLTNDRGEFSIAAQPDDWISVSFIGFKVYEFRVSENQAFITVRLMPLTSGLKEVVVSTGYQNVPLERATGSFSKLDNELFNRRVSGNVLDRLEGVVPGLLFNRNQPGSPLTIRGYSTIFSNTDPLIVVDNFPFEGNINNINPNDIENITVLKDAAAASIWGVRSGNGVIVITTKKGKRNQKMSVEANANLTIGDRPNVFYSPNFLDSKDYIGVEKSLFSQGFYDGRLSDPSYPWISPVVQILADQRSGKISQQQADTQIGILENNDIRNDIEKYLYRKSVNQQYSLNFRGGGVTNDYFFSAGYDHNLSNTMGDQNSRISLSSEQNFYPTKNLTLNVGLNLYQTNTQANALAGTLNNGDVAPLYPYARLVDKNGAALPIVHSYNLAWISDPLAQKGFLDWQYRPLDEINNADNTQKVLETKINAGLNYNFFDGLNFSFKYQHEQQKVSAENYYSTSSYYARNLINQYTNFSSSNTYPIPIGGISNQETDDISANKYRFQLNYTGNINSKHIISGLLGGELNSTVSATNRYNTIYGYDKSTGAFQSVDFTSSFVTTPQSSIQKIPNAAYFGGGINHYLSYFANGSYTYDERYGIILSGRIDKSNLFGVNTNQKAVPLYSIGFSWDLSKEKFYDFKWLPYSKFRITYGYNGNLNTSATAVTTFSTGSNSYISGITYNDIANPGNPSLRWEKDRMINLGWDFRSKNNILSGSIEYYLKKGVDLFGNSPLVPSTGLYDFFGNTASIAGSGLDVQFNINAVRTARLSWSTNVIFSHTITKITKYDKQILSAGSNLYDGGILNPIVGKPVYSIYSFKWGGLTHDTGDPQGYLNDKLSTDYAGIINSGNVDNLVFNGSATPTTFGSLRNNLSYGPLNLSINIIYKFNYFFRRSSVNYGGLTVPQNIDYTKRWTKPGDELSTNVPSMPATINNFDPNREYFYKFSSALVDKGDHIRLQDISLSYNIKNITFLKGISNLQLYSYINNVGVLWRANHDRLDPDLLGSSSLPLPRTIAFGLKMNF